jgi:hypothetical protein
MWEDFMRGNWPAAASAAPDPAQLPSAKSVAGPVRAARPVPAHIAGYAQSTPRPVAGKFAFRAAVAAGAGLVLAIVVPSSAVAGSAHVAGAHAHVAAHAATGP